jgi:Thiolase, C-terminal domain
MLSMPPDTMISAEPALMMSCASMVAFMPEPQTLLMVVAIGATGARLIVTLLHALEAQGLKRGVASLCIGGGEATAIAIERIVH